MPSTTAKILLLMKSAILPLIILKAQQKRYEGFQSQANIRSRRTGSSTDIARTSSPNIQSTVANNELTIEIKTRYGKSNIGQKDFMDKKITIAEWGPRVRVVGSC